MRVCLALAAAAILSGCYVEAMALPWGKDACLAQYKPASLDDAPALCGPLEKFGECMIAFHQDVISPADGPRSHFQPRSSQYTLDAIRKYGFFKGVVYGCDRLMRENNEKWIYTTTMGRDGLPVKYDPVR